MFSYEKMTRKSKAGIEGEMTIYNAEELAAKLLPILEDTLPLEINLSKVSEIDSTGVQLLMLAKKLREANETKLSLIGHSEAVMDVFELMGLVAYFNDPVVLTKHKGE